MLYELRAILERLADAAVVEWPAIRPSAHRFRMRLKDHWFEALCVVLAAIAALWAMFAGH